LRFRRSWGKLSTPYRICLPWSTRFFSKRWPNYSLDCVVDLLEVDVGALGSGLRLQFIDEVGVEEVDLLLGLFIEEFFVDEPKILAGSKNSLQVKLQKCVIDVLFRVQHFDVSRVNLERLGSFLERELDLIIQQDLITVDCDLLFDRSIWLRKDLSK
jgi:hypothetical protein